MAVSSSSRLLQGIFTNINEPAHYKTYNKTCATSEDSDQPAHPRSLIRVFADCLCRLQPPGYPKRDIREPLPYWVDVQADLSLCWSQRSYCRFCRALAHFLHLIQMMNIVNFCPIYSQQIKV